LMMEMATWLADLDLVLENDRLSWPGRSAE
jgi:hypothetical protein